MKELYLVFFCFLWGIFCKKTNLIPRDSYKILSRFIISVSLPAVILLHIPKIQKTPEIIFLVLVPWFWFGLVYVFLKYLSRFWNLTKKEFLAFWVSIGLGNTSFLGIPLLKSLVGESSIPFAVVFDQLGTFLILSLVIVPTLERDFTDHSQDRKKILPYLKTVLTFPPLVAFFFAFCIVAFGISYPTPVEIVLQSLGNTLAPIALVSVGILFDWNFTKRDVFLLVFALSIKLVLSPILFAGLFSFSKEELLKTVIVLESGMGSSITGCLLLLEKDIESKWIASMLSLSLFFSFFTVPILYQVLKSHG